jgi:Kef-type K+ transport system membrane component KefB
MTEIFFEIGTVLVLAAILAVFSHLIKQPLIVGYILAGIVAGVLGLFDQENLRGILDFFASFGITFLLFLVGLELRFADIKTFGPLAIVLGLCQVLVTTFLGVLLSILLGFSLVEGLFIALALSFSSTVIIVKLLIDKRDLDSLYGKVTVSLLLVQDALAILALVFVTGLGADGASFGSIIFAFFKSIILLATIFLASKTVIPALFVRAASSVEILFIISIAWVVLVSGLASYLGLSIESGAFLAGISLANLPLEHQIASRIRPLRDLFIVFFFVLLGVEITFGNVFTLALPILVLSLFVLIGKPAIVLVIMSFLGFR